MSQPNNESPRAPWIVAGVLTLVVAVLVLGFVHVHSASRNHARLGAGNSYGLTTAQQAAMNAAATEAANVTTYARKTFTSDFQRALNGATGSFKADLTGEKSTTLSTMQAGAFDLRGTVAATAFSGTTDNGKAILVLVTVNGYKVADNSSQNTATVQRLILTMIQSGKSWLADDLTASGIQ
jgi:hypothetical protein